MMIHARLLACRHFPSNNFIPLFWGKSVRSPDLNKWEDIMVPVKFCPWIEHGYGLVRSQFFLVKCAGHLVLDFLAAGGKVLMSNPLCGPAVQTEAWQSHPMKEFPNRRANMGFANLGGYFCTHVGGAGDFFFVFVLCAVRIPFGFNGFEIGGSPDVWSPHFRGYLSRPQAFDCASCLKVMLQSHAPTWHQSFRTFVAGVSLTYWRLDKKNLDED